MTWALHDGDCTTGMATLADGSVDVVCTDPPYSEHTHSKQWVSAALTAEGKHRVSSNYSGLGFSPITEEQARAVSLQFARIVRRWVLVFSDLEGIAMWREALVGAGLDYVRTCIWDKVDGAPQFTGDRPAAGAEAIICAHPKGKKRWNGGGRRNVLRHAVNGERGDKPHPSTKPLALMRELIELFTDPGELVLDAYAGSGSTGVACGMLGRDFIGWELKEEYAAIARRRLAGNEARPRPVQPSLFTSLTGGI